MATTDEIIKKYTNRYHRISYMDSLLSAFPIYFFIGMIILVFCTSLPAVAGLRGVSLLVVFFGAFVLVGYIWVKLLQFYELKTPLKKKIHQYRFSQGLECMTGILKDINEKSGGLVAQIVTDSRQLPVTMKYSQNLWLNYGGITPNAPFTVNVFKAPHPKTWFFEVRGETTRFKNAHLEIDFSGRKDDGDSMGGFGVRVYDKASKQSIKSLNKEQSAIVNQIKKLIAGSILKGTIEFDRGRFCLKIYDSIEKTFRWKRPVIRFKRYQNSDNLIQKGVPEEQTAFYGMDNFLSLLLS